MPISLVYLQQCAAATGFIPTTLEKVSRLGELAGAIARHPLLGKDEPRVIVATGRYAGEGFDDARLDTLFLAMPISWRGTLQQYVGRLHRTHPGKSEVRVYDYVDHNMPVLTRMFSKRLKGYHAMGYIVDENCEVANEDIFTNNTNVSGSDMLF